MAASPYHVGDSALCASHKFGAFRGKIGAITQDGPRPAALTAGSSRGLAAATEERD